MFEREDFKQRWINQSPIAIHEFMYPLVQGMILSHSVLMWAAAQTEIQSYCRQGAPSEYGQEPLSLVLMPLLEGRWCKKSEQSLETISVSQNCL
jgi:tyrosyl-tRNA synthetase